MVIYGIRIRGWFYLRWNTACYGRRHYGRFNFGPLGRGGKLVKRRFKANLDVEIGDVRIQLLMRVWIRARVHTFDENMNEIDSSFFVKIND